MKLEDDNYCFVCGKQNSSGLSLNFTFNNKKALAEFSIRKDHQGYKDMAHGGIISAILDEAMIKAALANGINAITAELNIRFKKPLLICETAVVKAEITKSGRRLIEAAAHIKGVDSREIAEGRGKLIIVHPK